jgi:hypothetical protein
VEVVHAPPLRLDATEVNDQESPITGNTSGEDPLRDRTVEIVGE